ncbi:MAG: MFS transporter [Kiritimatiellae bacterium]|nr:MFS transporter [Kiritimatiellia bacterium]
MGGQSHERSHPFGWLNATQFLGALNDNAFRWLVFFFIVGLMGDASKDAVIATCTTVFVLPFLLFSQWAGVLADSVSKRSVIVFSKGLEAVVMLLGCAAILSGQSLFLYGTIFLMSTQSAIFGPSKYGIIPELVPREKLSRANGWLVGGTYLAIIIGTFITPFVLREIFRDGFVQMGLICVGLAVVGWFASLRIPRTPAGGGAKRYNPLFIVEIFRTVKTVSSDGYLLAAIIGSAYFTYLGAFLQQNILLYGQEVLGLDWYSSGLLFPVAALGIGMGALLAGKLSGRNVEFGIVPIGAAGLALCCAAFFIVSPTLRTTRTLAFLMGVNSGLFIVPLNAFIQYRSPAQRRGEILACANFLSFVGVALSAATIMLFSTVSGLDPAGSFLILAVLTAVLVVVTVWMLPDFLTRFVVLMITRMFYRIRTQGLENVPIEGGAVLVSNHVSWVDALLIAATQQRRIRFVMARDIASWRPARWLFRLMRVIPVASNDPPRELVASLDKARKALTDGYIVCIFAEGGVTRNGTLGAFKGGVERIIKGVDVPVIPVYIGGAWGSIFSYYGGRLLWSFPRKVPYPVWVIFGKRMTGDVTPFEIRQQVSLLSGQWFDGLKNRKRTLAHRFVGIARRYWFHQALCDTTGKRLRFGRTLAASIALSEVLHRETENEDRVGILMPCCVAGALVNVAVTLLGKVPVNLNFTASESAFESAMNQCELRTVISSRAFLEKLEVQPSTRRVLFVEDLVKEISSMARVTALLKARFAPIGMLAKHTVPGPDDPAAIIFSSGSTAEPKGVVLSHHNLLSNVEGTAMLFRFRVKDKMCAVLPFFHSFGFTVTLWCPLAVGFSSAFHTSPLEAERVIQMIREEKLSFLAATPTFLLSYIRRAKKEDLQSLRAVYVGGEKLTQRVANAFEDRFDLRPFEGYGTTELSPVSAFNVPDVVDGAFTWMGQRDGSIGRPLPGVTMKIVDPGSGEELPLGDTGLLMVTGPNVMLGYLNRPDLNAEALDNGWYATGDIACMDEDGFVFITDRLSRFSKIGGEMVPHTAIEELLLAGEGHSRSVVVTGVPDEKKGEQIVVLYDDDAPSVEVLQERIRNSPLPNLWRPKNKNYFHVQQIPMLGTGKLDLQKIRGVAREIMDARPGALQRTVTKLMESL